MSRYISPFSCIAVLGAGTMGAQIAAHLVNSGHKVYLFDLPSEGEERSANVMEAKHNMLKMNPPPFGLSSHVESVIPANYDDHLSYLESCDLVIEAISENIKFKSQLYKTICPYLKSTAFLATNSSGLSIETLANVLPENIRERFCGVHFFNPPRFLTLVELIPSSYSSSEMLDTLETFLVSYLGKGVVRTKDTPNFIANRIGVFSLLCTAFHAERLNIPFEVVDQLTGTLLGRPKSATFRTLDIVGLDVFKSVVETMREGLPDDPFNELFVLPDWAEQLIDSGKFGEKTKAGVYKKTEDGLLVWDVELESYRPSDKKAYAGVRHILKRKRVFSRMLQLRQSEHVEGQFLYAVLRDLLHYCAVTAESIAVSVRDIDQAIRWGFGWEQGPFELWQSAGWRELTGWIESDLSQEECFCNAPLPEWVSNLKVVYEENKAYDFTQHAFEPRRHMPVYSRQLFPDAMEGETFNEGETVFENDGARVWHMGDDHLIISFKSKMCSVSAAVLEAISEAIREAEENYQSLIIWQRYCEHFSVGADLSEFAEKFINGGPDEIDKSLKAFQDTVLALRYAKVPTVAAARGYVLGGGCEVLMHCDAAVAAYETYTGLVEMGVGLIPAAGGTKEMALRAMQSDNPKKMIEKYFKQIAMAEVAKSAEEAKAMGYLRPSDIIIMNPFELLHVAKAKAASLAAANYTPPQPPKVEVFGRDQQATLMMAVANLHAGKFASDYDTELASAIATVICGSGLDAGERVDEAWLLREERRTFLNCVQNEKSQARVEYMLENGKPLRN